jgi:fumigallin biosynthesis monooxygenase-like protein
MAKVFPGRFTAQCQEPFVVFLIGMRVNRVFDLRWLRVARAMPLMIAELKRTPNLGLLHAEFFIYWRGVAVVQYWRSFELLHAYAHARDANHLPAWAEFNRRIGTDGSVGIWHETYTVAPGQFESIYGNMPRFGLARAVNHVSVTGILDSARGRIGKSQ